MEQRRLSIWKLGVQEARMDFAAAVISDSIMVA